MIVRQKNIAWSIIFHPSHRLLAQEIAARLSVAPDSPYWFKTKAAIGLHDDLHCVYESGKWEHLTDAGARCDFTLVPLKDWSRVQEMQDRIDDAYRKHTWLDIMQSKHAECLYSGEDVSAKMKRMLKMVVSGLPRGRLFPTKSRRVLNIAFLNNFRLLTTRV